MRTVLLILLLILPLLRVQAQFRAPVEADSIPIFSVPELLVSAKKPTPTEQRRHERRMKKYEKLEKNVRLVYPLAMECGRVVRQIDAEMEKLNRKHDQKEYAKRLEKDLFKRYEARMKKLTISQGRVLIKLIDRETGASAYSLIKEYKSGTSAVLWQGVAKIFGSNLKDDYDPEHNEDEFAIETIIYEIRKEQAVAAQLRKAQGS
jgi:Domain of unknown function (DUF4294)